jgi:hypothetical protein
MKALIDKNEIIDVVEVEFEVPITLSWIDCPDDCRAYEWTLVDGVPTPPTIIPPTYSESRKREYDRLNQFEMQFDDQRDGTTTWVDAINDIKDRFPK